MSKVVAVFGGCGQLGQVVVNHFKSAAWKTVSIDVRASDVADHAIVIKGDGSKEDSQGIIGKIKEWKLGTLARTLNN